MIATIEGGRANVTLASVGKVLDALRARPDLRVELPYLADRRAQREPAHARCIGYVRRRLGTSGWIVSTEVEIGGRAWIGWIDVLAFEPRSSSLMVVEVKTEMHDLGRIERTQSWYEREAWAAARRLGWRPRRIAGLLLLLQTEANEARVSANRQVLSGIFPARQRQLAAWLAGPTGWPPGQRGMAMIDPRSRRRAWLLPTRVDGRRSPARYRDYADFVRSRSTSVDQRRRQP